VRLAALALAVSLLTALVAASAPAAGLEPRVAALLTALDRATPGGRSGDPELVQARYDAARDLVEALRRRQPGCAELRRYARLSVAATEAFDRQRPAGRLEAAVDRARAGAEQAPCDGSGGPGNARDDEPDEPLGGEAFFGLVRAAVPPGARRAEIRLGAELLAVRSARAGRELRAQVEAPARAGELELRFLDAAGRIRGRRSAAGVTALPTAAARAGRPPRPDAGLADRLATTTRRFAGAAAVWVHDLGSGRAAGVGETVRFPAASTVKLGVLAAALDRFGPRPERSAAAHDLAALAAWSSNLAANRLLRLLGGGDERRGVAVVEERLRRLGAEASTYPGGYRAGTVSSQTPPATGRVTTARDLGRILATMHAAAAGRAAALGRARLSRHEARAGLALLLASERSRDNAGLLGLPAGLPTAQKHGWTSSTRHSAAIVYRRDGPVIVVVLTYAPGLRLADARRLGAQVARIALA
jgi:beta-lactamase class A